MSILIIVFFLQIKKKKKKTRVTIGETGEKILYTDDVDHIVKTNNFNPRFEAERTELKINFFQSGTLQSRPSTGRVLTV